MGFYQQLLQTSVLSLEIAGALQLSDIHTTIFVTPFVEGGPGEASLAADFLDGHVKFGLFEGADDLLFGGSALFHIHHSPSVAGFSLVSIGMYRGGG